MKIRFKKKVGSIEFEIEEEAANQAAIFDVVEFWSSLPESAPNGSTDLRFAHRVADEFDFYEIVSEKEGKRFCFGQRKKGDGVLFPKGWQDTFHKDGQPDPPQNNRQPPPPVQPASNGSGLDSAIRGELQRLGVNNPGQEKTIVMKALRARTGLLVAELDPTEKADLLEVLRAMEIATGRAA